MKFVIIVLLAVLVQLSFASETVKGAKKDLDKFKQDMSVELQAIEKKLEVLAEKAEKKSDKVYKETAKDLTEKRDKLRKDLYELEADSKGKWKKAKSDFATSLNNLNEKIQKALKD